MGENTDVVLSLFPGVGLFDMGFRAAVFRDIRDKDCGFMVVGDD